MRTSRLTEKRLENLKPKASRYELFDGGGLGIRVGPSGARTWFMIYRDQTGRQRRLTLGQYPALTLANARIAHAQKLKAVGLGQAIAPPSHPSRRPLTVAALWERFFAAHVQARLKPRTQGQYSDTWQNHLEPALGRRRLASVAKADVRALHAEIGAQGKTRAANLAVAVLRSALSWAIDQELMPGPNPAAGVRLYADARRDRYLTADEIGRLLLVLEADAQERGDWTAHDVIKLLLFTGARRGNVQRMRWQDVDWQLRRWLVPASDTKTARMYNVALPPGAIAILERRRAEVPTSCPWVFPGRPDQDTEAAALTTIKGHWSRIRERAELPGVRLHDLRHTAASMLINAGASLAIVAHQLGHARTETSSRYAHLVDEVVRAAVDRATASLHPEAPALLPEESEGR